MTEAQALALLKLATVRLSEGYARRGFTAYVIVQNHDGTIDITGPTLPADVVDDLFGAAAEGYALSEGQHPMRT